MNKARLWRWLRRALGAAAAAFALLVLSVIVSGWAAFGRAAEGTRRARVELSRQWRDGQFHNPEPLWNDVWGWFGAARDASPNRRPEQALPVVAGNAARFGHPPSSGLRVTWLGHSTLLVEVDGHRVLTDPVWSNRASPLTWLGPERWYAPPIALSDLPPLDAVVISHDHYDHLDHPTIVAMKDWKTTFIVPLGVGAHLAYWGVPESRIVELDWWQERRIGELTVVSTPARHASGRTLIDNDRTLWAGYAFIGPRHRVYFSGDTGLFPALDAIGARLGPFDATLIEAGAYGRTWPDWHLGPEQAVRAHRMVRGRVMLPIHWGLFNLAYHAWTEPVERVLAAARQAGVKVVVPRPGESIEPSAAPDSVQRWWPAVPWKTAEEDPIVATRMPLAAPRGGAQVSAVAAPAPPAPSASAATASVEKLPLRVATRSAGAAVVDTPGKWTRECQVHSPCARTPALPTCRDVTPLDATAFAEQASEKRLDEVFAVRGALRLGNGFTTAKRCAVTCCNSQSLEATVGDAPFAVALEELGCSGDESRLCCFVPAFGQQVVAKGKLRSAFPGWESFDVKWALADVTLCEERPRR